jgi:hypothetical protein
MATKRSKAVAIKPDEEWRCESDCHVLMEAEKIKADPKRYEKAKAYAKKKMMEAAAVATDD